MKPLNWPRLLVALLACIGAMSLAGCSQQPSPSTEAEKTSFLGDPSKMPADQKAKLQQFQQEGAQRAVQSGAPKNR